MKMFASLLERLLHEPARNRKLDLLVDYLNKTPDPDRGYAIAALTGNLVLESVKPAMLRRLIEDRVDPVLFRLSYDFVGDLSETIALLWPGKTTAKLDLDIGRIVEKMSAMKKQEAAAVLPMWLDALDARERWALLKLVTGALRVGVSTGLAKQALARWSGIDLQSIEEVWHAFKPPYFALFSWLSGTTPRPDVKDAVVFSSPMLAHPLDREALDALDPSAFSAEWKWDGIRIQLHASEREGRRRVTLFSRSGEDITGMFPDIVDAFPVFGTIDGELVAIDRDNPKTADAGWQVSFAALQQRLNRKSIPPKILARYPARIIAYDLLFAPDREGIIRDLREKPFSWRRECLEHLVLSANDPRLSLSPLITFRDWDELAAERAASANWEGIEGVMLKRAAGPYLAGRVAGEWFKWKRNPHLLDCVMMYAQRGHGKRASIYSDFTFGVWDGANLVPVGKAYFGFTDAELADLDRFVRHNTINRFGPVREVAHEPHKGMVLEIAFEGVQRSGRHKSGFAMRFPRVNRIRLDKVPEEADRIEALAQLAGGKTA